MLHCTASLSRLTATLDTKHGKVRCDGMSESLFCRCSLRSVGLLPCSSLCAAMASTGAPFQLSATHRLHSRHSAAVTSLSCEGVEWRYLLSADSHGLLALYDTQPALHRPHIDSEHVTHPSSESGHIASAAHQSGQCWYVSHPLSTSTVTRSVGGEVGGSSVNSVVWYPVDTGMFVSGGQDGGVHVWDTNTFSVEATFTMRDAAVNSVSMSPLAAASTHSLIAVGSTDLNVRLCDVSSGGFAHTLIGHQAEVTCVCWTPFSEFLLATSSVDRVSPLSQPSTTVERPQQQLAIQLLTPHRLLSPVLCTRLCGYGTYVARAACWCSISSTLL